MDFLLFSNKSQLQINAFSQPARFSAQFLSARKYQNIDTRGAGNSCISSSFSVMLSSPSAQRSANNARSSDPDCFFSYFLFSSVWSRLRWCNKKADNVDDPSRSCKALNNNYNVLKNGSAQRCHRVNYSVIMKHHCRIVA